MPKGIVMGKIVISQNGGAGNQVGSNVKLKSMEKYQSISTNFCKYLLIYIIINTKKIYFIN